MNKESLTWAGRQGLPAGSQPLLGSLTSPEGQTEGWWTGERVMAQPQHQGAAAGALGEGATDAERPRPQGESLPPPGTPNQSLFLASQAGLPALATKVWPSSSRTGPALPGSPHQPAGLWPPPLLLARTWHRSGGQGHPQPHCDQNPHGGGAQGRAGGQAMPGLSERRLVSGYAVTGQKLPPRRQAQC